MIHVNSRLYRQIYEKFRFIRIKYTIKWKSLGSAILNGLTNDFNDIWR